MRKIELKEPEGKVWTLWRKACEDATALLHTAFANNAPLEITDLYKRKSVRKLYFFADGAPFYRKCAFCERPIPDLRDGDVEHFRPKAAITDENDNVIFLLDDEGKILVDAAGQPMPHPGYYWLAYDWRNLLIACRRCNQPTTGNLGKKARFPVAGKHARRPAELALEEPLLINPASGLPQDDPELHLDVQTSGAGAGILFAKSPRGEMCLQVFGLNDHADLISGRVSAANDVRFLLVQMLSGEKNAATSQLDAILSGKKPFTMASRAALREAKQNLPHLLAI